jgi:protein-arginine kinase activator protein McsA
MTLVAPYQFVCKKCGEPYRTNSPYGVLSCFQCYQEAMDPVRKMQDNWFAFSEYLKKEISEGKTEFRISFQDESKFIVHPLSKDGQTIDLNL